MNETVGKFLRIGPAAAYLGLSPHFLYKLASKKRIPCVKVGRILLFEAPLLDKWVARRRVLPRDWVDGDSR